MATGYQRFCRSSLTAVEGAEMTRVDALADLLKAFLDESAPAIDAAHVHGASSMAIQTITARLLRERLGFSEEQVLTPESGLVVRPRPDFYFDLGPGRGILAEVERGGTTTNNHDLKDFWKTHIASDAHHLFLLVPNSNWSESGASRERPFTTVSRRLGAFFGDPRREVDVMSVHVFGYGRAASTRRPGSITDITRPAKLSPDTSSIAGALDAPRWTPADGFGLGRVTEEEITRFRTWLRTSKSPTVSPRVAGDYVSRLRRVLRGDDVSTLTSGVQRDIETTVRTFLRFRSDT